MLRLRLLGSIILDLISSWIYQLGSISLDLSHLLGWTRISAAAVWLTLTTASSVTLLRFPVLTSRLNSWTNQRSVFRSRDQLCSNHSPPGRSSAARTPPAPGRAPAAAPCAGDRGRHPPGDRGNILLSQKIFSSDLGDALPGGGVSGGVAVVVDGVAAEVHHPDVRAEAGGEVGVARVVAAPRPPPLLVNSAAEEFTNHHHHGRSSF